MTYASIDKFIPTGKNNSKNILDRWVLAKYQELVNKVNESMEKYDPYKASNAIVDFVGELSTWYIRRSRRRFWKSENDADKMSAYETLYGVILGTIKLLAPFAPMFAETIYQQIRKNDDPVSVHLCQYPAVNEPEKKVLEKMAQARMIVEAGLSARAESKIKIRQPLQSLLYFGQKLDKELEEIISEEVNVKEVNYSVDESKLKVKLDIKITPELKREGIAREIIRNIQSLRKKTGFQVEDRIIVYYNSGSENINSAIEKLSDKIAKEVLANEIENTKIVVDGDEEFNIEGETVWIGVKKL